MIYNVVLFSTIGNGGGAGENFFYDWTQMPDVPYKITFKFLTPINLNTNGNNIASIFVDLGQSQNKLAQSTGVSSLTYKGSFLGFVGQSGIGAATFLFASATDNPATFIPGRPRNNNFLVEVHNSDATSTDFNPAPNGYVLTLNFETI